MSTGFPLPDNFRRSAAAGPFVDLGDWSNPSDGTSDGQFGIDDNGIEWTWNAAKGIWLRTAPWGFGSVLSVGTIESNDNADPGADGFTETEHGDGAINYDDLVSGKVAVQSGDDTSEVSKFVGPGGLPADPDFVGILLEDLKATGVGAGVGAVQISFNFTEAAVSKSMRLLTGTATSPTNWCVQDDATQVDTGIPFGTAATLEIYFDREFGDVQIYVDREATPTYDATITAAATTSTAMSTYVVDNLASTQTTAEHTQAHWFTQEAA